MQADHSQCAYPEWPDCFGSPLERASPIHVGAKKPPKPPILPPSIQDHSHAKRLLQPAPIVSPEQIAFLARPPKCAFEIHCKLANATRKCYHCAKFDEHRTGFYCDACFVARHPPVRLDHSWTFLRDETDSKREWIEHLASHKMEQDFRELKSMLVETNAWIETAAGASNQAMEGKIQRAFQDIHAIDAGIRQVLVLSVTMTRHARRSLMDHVKVSLKQRNLTRQDAVRKIEAMWRVRQARKHFRQLLRSVYQLLEDPVTGQMYYYNKRTDTTQWDKPLGFGSEEYVPVKKPKRVGARQWTADVAAGCIQRSVRAFQAKMAIRSMMRDVYGKRKDPATGASSNVTRRRRFDDVDMYYYYNKRTGNVSWTKPTLFGSEDLATDEELEREARARRRAAITPPTPHDAAMRIQRCIRCAWARRRLRSMLSRVYLKVWDDARAQFYFYNTRTETVSWSKPKWVDEADLMSPRSHEELVAQEAAAARRSRLDAIRRSRPEEAVLYIQRMARCAVARRQLRSMLSQVYLKVWDDERGQFFFYNTRTQAVNWSKPKWVDESDLMSPRSHEELLAQEARRHHLEAILAASPDEAVRYIQRMVRRWLARRTLLRLVADVYEAILDPTSGEYFYHNKKTGDVSWTRPVGLNLGSST
ncbi:Aste57867_21005 [Aphanomyces stellatus]|uniref:Aste57867_21005 protein n=1 Tax=Aphanomyces stellatus TaxID=120398 RepID=A0A485LH06_9STRA|nr:hypothetical protein As57867_020937 [Aphanomyces stellatus]VFT97680.1 Aste57867_21005 [Aphanomyces stellatus]